MGQIIDVPGMGQVEFPDGMTDDQIVAAIKANAPKAETKIPGMETANSALDFVNRNIINPLGTGFTKGTTAILGAPRTAADLLEAGATWAGDKLGAPETGRKIGAGAKFVIPGGTGPRPEEMNKAIFGNIAPEVYFGDNPALTLTNPLGIDGKVNVGKMLDIGTQAIPGAIALGGGALPAFAGGMTSEAAGQATEGTPWELPARIFGSLPGAWLGAKATTPLPANLTPQQARAVQIAKETNTPLSVAQETGRLQGLERLFARTPGGMGRAEKFAARQGAATDEAALAQAGFKGRETGQDTMNRLAVQAGDEFEAAKRMAGTIDLTPTFPKVRAEVAKYEGVMDPARRSPAVTSEAGRILSKEAGKPTLAPLTATAVESPTPTLANLTTAIRNASKSVDEAFDALPSSKVKDWFTKPNVPMPKAPPELSSAQYQTLRKDLTEAVKALYRAGDSNGAIAVKNMRTALDDALEASLGGDKLAKWQEARRHYANFKIIQKAMNSGTTQARSEGTLGANALNQALRKSQGDKFYQTTGGLNDIATLKGYLRDTFPNSGTPTLMAQMANVPLIGLPAVGSNIGMRALTGGPRSNIVRNYLANQLQPDRLGSVATAPFTLAPGMQLRLTDQRGAR